VVEASDQCRAQIVPQNGSVTVIHPAVPTQLPLETGCFKFEYDMFTRRQ
jgi:hypothetical protein